MVLFCMRYLATKDVLKLRNIFRIIGNLIGGLPQFQQQNVFNGIPLVLSKEEVTLLLSL